MNVPDVGGSPGVMPCGGTVGNPGISPWGGSPGVMPCGGTVGNPGISPWGGTVGNPYGPAESFGLIVNVN